MGPDDQCVIHIPHLSSGMKDADCMAVSSRLSKYRLAITGNKEEPIHRSIELFSELKIHGSKAETC